MDWDTDTGVEEVLFGALLLFGLGFGLVVVVFVIVLVVLPILRRDEEVLDVEVRALLK